MFDSTSPPAWTLRLGDAGVMMSQLRSASVDLVYMDPPFNSGVKRRGSEGLAFNDSFPSIGEYRAFLRPLLESAHRVLAPRGSILVHVDWRTSHHVRLWLDELFGAECFVNHLIWSYGLGGSGPRSFARKHDDILFYGRTQEYYFEVPRVAATSVRLRGKTKKATDVLDVPAINNMALERTGWPTQKPEELLAMLVRACSPEGATVLDPMCGSGTTLAAAVRSGRRAIGFDQAPEAIAIARERLERCGAGANSVTPTRPTTQGAPAAAQVTPEYMRTG